MAHLRERVRMRTARPHRTPSTTCPDRTGTQVFDIAKFFLSVRVGDAVVRSRYFDAVAHAVGRSDHANASAETCAVRPSHSFRLWKPGYRTRAGRKGGADSDSAPTHGTRAIAGNQSQRLNPSAALATESANVEPEVEPEGLSATAADAPHEFGVSDAEALRVCEEMGLEEILACAFRDGGVSLTGGGRVDVLEFESRDSGMEETTALLVIRTPEEPEFPTTEELASAHSVPGEDVSYDLGELVVSGDRISIRFAVVSETHPNTGDPSRDPGTETERDEFRIECENHSRVWECEKESL